MKYGLMNRGDLLKLGWRVVELGDSGIHRLEAEMTWLLETIPECNQKYVSWPYFSDHLALTFSSR